MEVLGGIITANVLQSHVPHYISVMDMWWIKMSIQFGDLTYIRTCVCVSMYCIIYMYLCRLHCILWLCTTIATLRSMGIADCWNWLCTSIHTYVRTYVCGIYIIHTIYVRAYVTYSYWWAIYTARYSTWNSSQQAMLRPCHRHHHHPVERDTDRQTHWQTDTNTHIQCMCTHLLLNGVIICSLYKIRTKAESSLTHTCTHPHPHTHTLQLSSCNQSWPPS